MDKFYRRTTESKTIHYGIFAEVTMRITEDENKYVSEVTSETEGGIIDDGGEEISSVEYNEYLIRVGSRPPSRPPAH